MRAVAGRPDVQEVDHRRAAHDPFAGQALELNVQQVEQFQDQRNTAGLRSDGPRPNDVRGVFPGAAVVEALRFAGAARCLCVVVVREAAGQPEQFSGTLVSDVFQAKRQTGNGQVTDQALPV